MSEPTQLEIALRAVDSGDAGHWPTVAGVLADEVRRLKGVFPTDWEFCPECGSRNHHHYFGYAATHRVCDDCSQEWHTDINYLDVVRGNFSIAIRTAKASREPANDGGPAFPGAFPNGDNRGMTLRDHFAGKAMANLATRSEPAEAIAARAYKLADAMLAERSKGGPR